VCQLNIYRSSHPGLEQLDLDSSDATAHLEKRLALDSPLFDESKIRLKVPSRPLRRYRFASPAAFFSLKICR